MSHVTNLVLLGTFEDWEPVERLGELLTKTSASMVPLEFGSLDLDLAHGNKGFEGDVLALAFDGVLHDEVVEAFKTQDWNFPTQVVLIAQAEDGPAEVYRPTTPIPENKLRLGCFA